MQGEIFGLYATTGRVMSFLVAAAVGACFIARVRRHATTASSASRIVLVVGLVLLLPS